MGLEVDKGRLHAALDAFQVELPSWGFSNTGTRFRVFPQPGAPRSVEEKIEDAGTVHRYTGSAPMLSLHIPWDKTDDYSRLIAVATDHGLRIGSINSNTFQDEEYRLGSLAHPDSTIRERALGYMLECCEIVSATRAQALKVWLADGTNYPGQDDMRARKSRVEQALGRIHAELPEPARLLVEYKFYEPAFYQTDIQDWGMALLLCEKAGSRARVVVDLGHHAHGVNIEQIVAILLSEGRLGAFDLNDRKYGDDDLMAGSINPFQLFLILNELVGASMEAGPAADCARSVAYMVDQTHNIEPKIPALIRTVMTLQESWLKAHLVERSELLLRQQQQDIVGANGVLKDAFDTDVRRVVAQWRTTRGLPSDPLQAYRESGEAAKRVAARQGGVPAGWV